MGGMGIVAIALMVYVFVSSLQPSARAKAARSQHDIRELQAGQYRYDIFSRGSAWNEKVLLIRDWDHRLYVYLVPTEDDKVPLPERWWWWGWHKCSDFRPETDKTGFLKKGGVIKCHDEDLPEWGMELWQWSYDGEPKKNWIAKMKAPSIDLKDDYIYINK